MEYVMDFNIIVLKTIISGCFKTKNKTMTINRELALKYKEIIASEN
jgi:hypothetical protein